MLFNRRLRELWHDGGEASQSQSILTFDQQSMQRDHKLAVCDQLYRISLLFTYVDHIRGPKRYFLIPCKNNIPDIQR